MPFTALPASIPVLADEDTLTVDDEIVAKYTLNYDKFVSTIQELHNMQLIDSDNVHLRVLDGSTLYPDDYDYDVSANGDGSVMLYADGQNLIIHTNDQMQNVYIQTREGLFAYGNLGINFSEITLSNCTFLPKDSGESTLSYLFAGQTALYLVDLETSLDTLQPVSAEAMFYGCSALTDIRGLQYLHTESLTDASDMFNLCSSLESLDIRGWDFCNITRMSGMFANCTSMQEILGLSELNPRGNLTHITSIFENCKQLTEIDLSTWNLNSVVNAESAFQGCESLKTIDICGWTMETLVGVERMMQDSYEIETIYNNTTTNLRSPQNTMPIDIAISQDSWIYLRKRLSNVNLTATLADFNNTQSGLFTQHTHTYTLMADSSSSILDISPAIYSLGDTIQITTTTTANEDGAKYLGVKLISENGHAEFIEADDANSITYTAEVGNVGNLIVQPVYEELTTPDDDDDDNQGNQGSQDNDDNQGNQQDTETDEPTDDVDTEQPTEERTEIILPEPIEQIKEVIEDVEETITNTVNTGITSSNYVVIAIIAVVILLAAVLIKKIRKNKVIKHE